MDVFLSRVFCVGSKDMNTRVYGAQKFKNLIVFSMGGHRDEIVNAFFEHNSLDVSFCLPTGNNRKRDCSGPNFSTNFDAAHEL